jgi:hypothetical protein
MSDGKLRRNNGTVSEKAHLNTDQKNIMKIMKKFLIRIRK